MEVGISLEEKNCYADLLGCIGSMHRWYIQFWCFSNTATLWICSFLIFRECVISFGFLRLLLWFIVIGFHFTKKEKKCLLREYRMLFVACITFGASVYYVCDEFYRGLQRAKLGTETCWWTYENLFCGVEGLSHWH